MYLKLTFLAKNGGEKWFRKKYFEIPSFTIFFYFMKMHKIANSVIKMTLWDFNKNFCDTYT